jgi:hypothetical protein
LAATASVIGILPALAFAQVPGQSQLLFKQSFNGFEAASRCEFLSAKTYIVVERSRHRIHLVGAGNLTVGGAGWGENSFDQPAGITSNGLSIYVADYGNHRVVQLDVGLRFVTAFGPTVLGDGTAERLGFPLDVALTSQNELIVLDGENSRAVRFSREGKFIQSFGQAGSFEQRIRSPRGLRIDRHDNVLILEKDRILEYDQFGSFLNHWSLPNVSELRGIAVQDSVLLLATERAVLWCSRVGHTLGVLKTKELIADTSGESIQDIAVRIDRVLILTSNHLLVYQELPP